MKISSPLLSADGNNLLSDGASIVTRWREYFSTLLNRPQVDPPPSLIQAASEAMVDASIPIDHHPSVKLTRQFGRSSSSICSIHPEYIHYAGGEAMHYLTNLFCTGDGDCPRGMASGYHNPTLQTQGISLRLPQLQRDSTTVGSRKSILACSVGENSASVTCASKTTEWVHAWSLYM